MSLTVRPEIAATVDPQRFLKHFHYSRTLKSCSFLKMLEDMMIILLIPENYYDVDWLSSTVGGNG